MSDVVLIDRALTVQPPVNGAGVTRVRATRVEMERRLHGLVELAREAQPASVRHIYYRAVVTGLVPKNERGYTKVQRALVDLRRRGVVPFNWILDNGRAAHWPLTEQSPTGALKYLADSYRRDPWREREPGSPRVEIWTESESIAGVLKPLKDEFAVPIFPLKGQGSESFCWEAARTYALEASRPVTVLYAGDYDPAGLEIGSQCEGKLREYSGRDDLVFRRLAVTDEQAAGLQAAGLGTPAKKKTWRGYDGALHAFGGQAVEAEAIDAPVLRRLFAEAITSIADFHFGRDIFSENQLIEERERAQLRELARGWSV